MDGEVRQMEFVYSIRLSLISLPYLHKGPRSHQDSLDPVPPAPAAAVLLPACLPRPPPPPTCK